MNAGWSKVVVTAMLAGLVAGCGGGGGGGGALTPVCTDKLWIDSGDYAIENNTYQNDTISPVFTGFEQCVAIQPAAGGKVNAKWTWNWPVPSTQPVTFRALPEVIYGQKPWSESTNSALPKRADTIQSVTVSGDYTGEVSADTAGGGLTLWAVFTSSNVKAGDHLPVSAIVYVFLAQYGDMFDPAARDAQVTIGGTQFDVYAFSSGSNPAVSFVNTSSTPPAHFSYDVRDFVTATDGLFMGDLVAPTDYLADIEFGTEVWNGTGQAEVSNFGVAVTSR